MSMERNLGWHIALAKQMTIEYATSYCFLMAGLQHLNEPWTCFSVLDCFYV